MSGLAVRKKGWLHCHLEVTDFLLANGETFLLGFVVETKSGIIREPFYRARYTDQWEQVLDAKDVLSECL